MRMLRVPPKSVAAGSYAELRAIFPSEKIPRLMRPLSRLTDDAAQAIKWFTYWEDALPCIL